MVNFLKQLLDWIYHKKCYCCNRASAEGWICEDCTESIDLNAPTPIKNIAGVRVYSAGSYGGNLRKIIKGLKYHRKKDFAKFAAKILYEYWLELDVEKKNYTIISVPMHKNRKRKRGYNHTELIAEEFSRLTGYPADNSMIFRVKDTRPLYGLSRAQRMDAIQGAFEAVTKNYKNTPLLIIDDICTTGATLGEIIGTLNRQNIEDITALVIANPLNPNNVNIL